MILCHPLNPCGECLACGARGDYGDALIEAMDDEEYEEDLVHGEPFEMIIILPEVKDMGWVMRGIVKRATVENCPKSGKPRWWLLLDCGHTVTPVVSHRHQESGTARCYECYEQDMILRNRYNENRAKYG